jgi:lipoyl(octanoyl) transferase
VSNTSADSLLVRHLGQVDYLRTYQAMQDFTTQRDSQTPDEIWLCEHAAVFTQGLAGLDTHVLSAGTTPVVATNRGGQVTYHGPGQVVAYALIDLRRAGYFVKEYVYKLEEAIVRTLLHFGVTGLRVGGAPGVFVRPAGPSDHALLPARPVPHGETSVKPMPAFDGLAKIAALGVKVSRHCTYHGLALNVHMDLLPFQQINPCGYQGLQTTDLFTMGVDVGWHEAADVLGEKLRLYLAP